MLLGLTAQMNVRRFFGATASFVQGVKSAQGQKRKSSVGLGMSGVGGRADIEFGPLDVCF
jgi:pyruvate/2-oxoacid:ferredoxin oxidoreductase beta subunit